MNKITIKINGIEYTLKGEENEEYLQRVASYVDKKLKNIMENNTKLSVSSAAILTAANVVDELFKYEAAYNDLRNKFRAMQKEEVLLSEQAESIKKQLTNVETHNKELQDKISFLESKHKNDTNLEDLESLKKEFEVLQEASKSYVKENNELRSTNKELKFQLQSAKYKLIDLQHRLIDNQIDLVKIKKNKNALISDKFK